MRILCHAQHLTGVGHFVRMQAIARGLSGAHEVYLTSGGRSVPRPPGSTEPQLLPLPPLTRIGDDIVALESPASAGSVLEARARLLARAVERLRPDVILVDHYPFSKWELEPEVSAAVDAARRCQASVRILCSLRDVVRQSRHERVDNETYQATVLAALDARFDGLLVHADPAFTRLEEHFERSAALTIPVAYTGFVTALPHGEAAPLSTAYAVLSCGGGARHRAFLLAAMEAFRRLAAEGALGVSSLVVFPAAFADDTDLEVIESAARGGPFDVRRFGPEFERYLAGSTLSISRAGYKTCAALLAARVRAVLVPDPQMSDQSVRAKRLAALGIATRIDGDETNVSALMTAIRRAEAGPPPRHHLAIDGVARTRALVETVETWAR